MRNQYYVLILEPATPLYKAKWRGDPGRTYDINNATRYSQKQNAKAVLTRMRNKYGRKFKDAKILQLIFHES